MKEKLDKGKSKVEEVNKNIKKKVEKTEVAGKDANKNSKAKAKTVKHDIK